MGSSVWVGEQLEDRTLLTNYVVDAATDDVDDVDGNSDGLISLREAINAANSNAAFGDAPAGGASDTITFAASLQGATISLFTGFSYFVGGGGDLTIDGGGQGISLNANDAGRILEMRPDSGASATVQGGLTFEHGDATGEAIDDGGAILITGDGTINLQDLTVKDNKADGAGGGILVLGGTVNLSGLTVEHNTSNFAGGGILVAGGMVTDSGSVIRNNTAEFHGGGIGVVFGGDLTLNGTMILDNTVTGSFSSSSAGGGGGIYIEDPGRGTSLNATGISVIGNTAQDVSATNGGHGGGILVFGNEASVSLTDSLVSDNMAARDGGQINNQGIMLLTNTTVEGAVTEGMPVTAAVRGGGIFNASGANLTMTGGSITGGLATQGGGLFSQGRTQISGATIQSNIATLDGGGLWNSASSLLLLQGGTLVQNNTASGQGGGGIFNQGGGAQQPGGRLAIAGGVTISGNTADGTAGSGGGIFSVNGVLTIDDSAVTGNSAVRAGGGIEMITGTVELTNTNLDGNMALGGGANAPGNGGGLHVTGQPGQVGYVRIFGGTVNNNTANKEGGGLWNEGGNIMVVRQGAIVSGNTASGDEADDGGGGIFNNGGRLSIGEGAQITSNHANGALGSGGGIFTTESGVSLSAALVSGNTAVRAGGGIEMVRGLVTITGSMIEMNRALGGGVGAPGNGGGIHISGTTGFPRVDVIGSEIDQNAAAISGGGIWMQAGSVVLVRIGSQVNSNEAQGPAADNGGGGIYNQGGRLVINSANLNENRASGAQGSGGGILAVANVTTAENSRMEGNTAVRAGGGIEIINGLFESRNLHLGGNEALGGGAGAPGNGGGIHVTGTSNVRVNLFESFIGFNTAASQGGGAWNESGSIMVIAEQSHFSVNSAGVGDVGDGGAGIYNNGGRLAVLSTLISGSEATGQGGAIFSTGGGVSVDNSTLAFNNATTDGGGIFSLGDLAINNSTIAQSLADSDDNGDGMGGGIVNGGTATLRNSLIVGNVLGAAFVSSDVVGNNLSAGSRNTLISDAATAGGLTDGVGGHIIGINGAGVRPIFTVVNPIGDNGGPLHTYSLAPNSVALNAGNNFFAKDASGLVLTTDQRGPGFARIVGGTVDMGAFEEQL